MADEYHVTPKEINETWTLVEFLDAIEYLTIKQAIKEEAYEENE